MNPFETTTGQVILNGAAGPSGRVVTLTSNDPVIGVPATVTVPSGQRRATFTISNTSNVLVGGSATITAQIGTGPSATTNVSYGDFHMSSIQFVPSTIVGGNKVGVIASTNVPLPAETALGFDWSGATGSFPTLVLLPKAKKTTIFSIVPDGVDSPTVLHVDGLVNNPPGPGADLTILPATVSGVTYNSVFSGLKSTGYVVLDGAAGPSGTSVSLSGIGVTVPSSVSVPAGARTVAFAFTPDAVDVNTSCSIEATQGAKVVTVGGTVQRAIADKLVPSSTTSSGGKVTVVLRLKGMTGSTPVTFSLNSDDPSISVPSSVTVPGGRSSWPFVATVTSTGGVSTPVTLTATGPTGVGSASCIVTVN